MLAIACDRISAAAASPLKRKRSPGRLSKRPHLAITITSHPVPIHNHPVLNIPAIRTPIPRAPSPRTPILRIPVLKTLIPTIRHLTHQAKRPGRLISSLRPNTPAITASLATTRRITVSPTVVRRVTVKLAITRQAITRQAIIRQATVRPAITRPATTRPTVIRPTVIRLTIIRPAITSLSSINLAIARPTRIIPRLPVRLLIPVILRTLTGRIAPPQRTRTVLMAPRMARAAPTVLTITNLHPSRGHRPIHRPILLHRPTHSLKTTLIRSLTRTRNPTPIRIPILTPQERRTHRKRQNSKRWTIAGPTCGKKIFQVAILAMPT